jgi:hypothetical protein
MLRIAIIMSALTFVSLIGLGEAIGLIALSVQ